MTFLCYISSSVTLDKRRENQKVMSMNNKETIDFEASPATLWISLLGMYPSAIDKVTASSAGKGDLAKLDKTVWGGKRRV